MLPEGVKDLALAGARWRWLRPLRCCQCRCGILRRCALATRPDGLCCYGARVAVVADGALTLVMKGLDGSCNSCRDSRTAGRYKQRRRGPRANKR